MVEFARIAVGAGAPLRCMLCAPPVEHSFRSGDELASSIAEAARLPLDATGPNVCLSGPEPFEHPELPRIVLACRQAGVRRIAIETDGAALSVRANSAGVLAAGVHHLHVRVLDSDETHGDELAARPGRTRDSLAGIVAYLEAAEAGGVDVVVTMLVPVCPHNVSSLPAIVTRAAYLGVHAVRLLSDGPPLSGSPLPPLAPAMLAAACDTGMVNGVWVEADGHLPVPDTHRLHVVPGGACDD